MTSTFCSLQAWVYTLQQRSQGLLRHNTALTGQKTGKKSIDLRGIHALETYTRKEFVIRLYLT